VVLFEADSKDGYMHGFTSNYVKVRAKYDPLLVNDLKEIKLIDIAEDGDVNISETEILTIRN
jgi:threonylcarbamoyladenosine tRNA methylthiotransferase MtaB